MPKVRQIKNIYRFAIHSIYSDLLSLFKNNCLHFSCVLLALQSCIIKRYCEKRFVSKYMTTIGIDYGVTKWVLLNTCTFYLDDSLDCKRNSYVSMGNNFCSFQYAMCCSRKIFIQYPSQSFWLESPFPFLGSRDGTVSRALPPTIVHLWKISILPLQEEFIANS